MCSSYTTKSKTFKEAYKSIYGLPWEDDMSTAERYLDPSGQNAIEFPGLPAPVITMDNQNVIQSYEFGFIPHWAHPDKLKEIKNTFNARIETISKLATWRDAWKNARRCLVCTNGFFEFDKQEKRRKFIHISDVKDFYFAGIYNDYVNRETGELRRTMAIITTVPNEVVAKIHNRMPVIIVPGKEKAWMDIHSNPGQLLIDFAEPFPASHMVIEDTDEKPKQGKQNKLFDED